MQPNFRVAPIEAQKFARVWTHNGLAIPLDIEHFQFATDFANVVLNSFVQDCNLKAQQRAAAKEKEAATALGIDTVNKHYLEGVK